MKIQLTNMNKTLKKVTGGDIVDGHYAIPEGVTEIRFGEFYRCTNLKNVVIPNKVQKSETVPLNTAEHWNM